MERCPDGWHWEAAPCRGANRAEGRAGEAAGGNSRPAGRAPGTEADRRLDRHARSARALAPAARDLLREALGRPVSAARLPGLRLGRVPRIRQEAGQAREALGEREVPVRRNPARSWFPLGQSSRALSATRHRGRSLLFSSRCRATRAFGPSQVSTTASLAHRMRRPRGAGAPRSKLDCHVRRRSAGRSTHRIDVDDAGGRGGHLMYVAASARRPLRGLRARPDLSFEFAAEPT